MNRIYGDELTNKDDIQHESQMSHKSQGITHKSINDDNRNHRKRIQDNMTDRSTVKNDEGSKWREQVNISPDRPTQ